VQDCQVRAAASRQGRAIVSCRGRAVARLRFGRKHRVHTSCLVRRHWWNPSSCIHIPTVSMKTKRLKATRKNSYAAALGLAGCASATRRQAQ
jgi:uncharacterized protein (DUF2126 family)